MRRYIVKYEVCATAQREHVVVTDESFFSALDQLAHVYGAICFLSKSELTGPVGLIRFETGFSAPVANRANDSDHSARAARL